MAIEEEGEKLVNGYNESHDIDEFPRYSASFVEMDGGSSPVMVGKIRG